MSKTVCHTSCPRSVCTLATDKTPVPTCTKPNFTSYVARSPTEKGKSAPGGAVVGPGGSAPARPESTWAGGCVVACAPIDAASTAAIIAPSGAFHLRLMLADRRSEAMAEGPGLHD